MAVETFQPKYTGMDLRLLVALVAFAWCTPVRLVWMAIFARRGRMFAIQWEKASMCEIAQPVHAIVAGQTL